MADAALNENGTRALPAAVTIDPQHPPKHTPREMQIVEAEIGKAGQDMTAGEGEQALVFFALRRLGYEPTWDDAADVFLDADTPDPLGAVTVTAPTMPLPDSAGTGE
jgi:hypothetical protein